MSNQDKSLDKNGEIARSIWLAGLGAYGRAFDEAMTRYEQASKDTPKLFKDLVKRGEQLETTTRNKVIPKELVHPTVTIEDRLRKVRSSLGLGNASNTQDLERLEHKIDLLSAKLDRLLSRHPIDSDPDKL